MHTANHATETSHPGEPAARKDCSAAPPRQPLFASSPVVATLLIALLAAVLIQGGLLAALYLKGTGSPAATSPVRADTPVKPPARIDRDPAQAAPAIPQAPASPGAGLTDDFFSDDWQPFAEMARMRERLDRLFEDSFSRFRSLPGFEEDWLSTDWDASGDSAISDEGDTIVVTLDIPGADATSLEVRLEDNLLTVSGQRTENVEQRDGSGKVTGRTGSRSSFRRAVSLPGDIDSAGMTSAYRDGVLTITIPKAGTGTS